MAKLSEEMRKIHRKKKKKAREQLKQFEEEKIEFEELGRVAKRIFQKRLKAGYEFPAKRFSKKEKPETSKKEKPASGEVA
jgi:hypothetical protein